LIRWAGRLIHLGLSAAGCVIEARVGTKKDRASGCVRGAQHCDGGGEDFTGALVWAQLDGVGIATALAGVDNETAPLDCGLCQRGDAAAAVEAIGWEDGRPDGVVVAKYLASWIPVYIQYGWVSLVSCRAALRPAM
jgi:hypothetical protein